MSLGKKAGANQTGHVGTFRGDTSTVSQPSRPDETRPDPLWKTWDALANKHGEHATVHHTNGDKYRGQYEGNLRHGAGTLYFKNGDKYEGEFKGGMQHGFGTHWVNKDGKLRMHYRGGFGYGKRQGQGILALQDGGKYEGEWMAGKRDGQGKMIYPDGSVYEGMWKEGKRHGPGTQFYTNGDIFQGEHAFDLKDGPGTFFYVSKNKRYDGVWSKDMGKCGLYGTIEQQGDDGDSGLPRLTLLEPMGVLENEAYALQEKRQLEQSRVIDNPNDSSAIDRYHDGDITGESDGDYLDDAYGQNTAQRLES